MGVVALALWLRVVGWRFGFVDSLSSLGFVIMAGLVGVVALIGWLQDWRMLRTLRRHLVKTRAERKAK
jgi:hypothetical protein